MGSGMCLFASLIRCGPSLFSEDARASNPHIIAFVHTGQIVNACVAPLIQVAPSLLSATWFSATERNWATAIANAANAMGRAIGFYLGPAIVKSEGDMITLLLVEVGMAVVPFLCAVVHFPKHPVIAPSPSAALARHRASLAAEPDLVTLDKSVQRGNNGLLAHRDAPQKVHRTGVLKGFWAVAVDFARAMSNPSFALLFLSFGLQNGIYATWSTVLPEQKQFSPTLAGDMASVITFAGIAGGLLAGWLCDRRWLARRMKLVMVSLGTLASIPFAVSAFGTMPLSVFAADSTLLFVLFTAAGLFRGGLDPLFFEMATEMAHPVPPGTIGSILTFGVHVALIVTLSVPSGNLNKWIFVVMAGTMVFCTALISCVKEQ